MKKIVFGLVVLMMMKPISISANDTLKYGHRFSIDFHLSVDYVNWIVKPIERSYVKNDYNVPYKLEDAAPSVQFYFEPTLSCRLYKNLRIKTGLKFDRVGYKTNPILLSRGTSSMPDEYITYYNREFLIGGYWGLSQGLRISKKVKAVFSLGYCYYEEFHTTSDGAFYYGNDNKGHSVDASIGLSFATKSGDEITICPDFDYIITPYYIQYSDFSYPYMVSYYYYYDKLNYYSIGLEIGINFGLKERKKEK